MPTLLHGEGLLTCNVATNRVSGPSPDPMFPSTRLEAGTGRGEATAQDAHQVYGLGEDSGLWPPIQLGAREGGGNSDASLTLLGRKGREEASAD